MLNDEQIELGNTKWKRYSKLSVSARFSEKKPRINRLSTTIYVTPRQNGATVLYLLGVRWISRGDTMPQPFLLDISFFFFFVFFFLRIRLFHGTRGIPCKVQRPASQPVGAARYPGCEAKSRGEWSRKELSDCRHLCDGLSLINGRNIPPYTVTQASVTPGTCLLMYTYNWRRCVRARDNARRIRFCSVRNPPRKKRASYCRISANLCSSWKSSPTTNHLCFYQSPVSLF